MTTLYGDPEYDWQFMTTPQVSLIGCAFFLATRLTIDSLTSTTDKLPALGVGV